MGKELKITLLIVMASVAVTPSALAERESGHWRGDIHHFHERDVHHWATGHWYHGWHGGSLGWWWVVGAAVDSALWYSYAAPIYPYPDPFVPAPVAGPSTAQIAPPQVPQTTLPAESSVWYFCKSSNQYYPYVATCPDGWTTVPATPPPGR